MNENERTLYLEAAQIWFHQSGLTRDQREAALSALRLGFALGSDADPEKFLPAVAVEAAQATRKAAQEYRERQSRDLNQANITEALGQFGRVGGGLW